MARKTNPGFFIKFILTRFGFMVYILSMVIISITVPILIIVNILVIVVTISHVYAKRLIEKGIG